MKAIAIIPGTTSVQLVDRPEPQVKMDDDVKIKIWQVGICGTDREEVSGGRAAAPDGEKELVIGHEMFGQVVETGSAVTRVSSGDFAVFTVRRGCGLCSACMADRSDMCFTGKYRERGIKQADGYQAEYVVDSERYIVKVPSSIRGIGVLTEPMSVAAKAIDEALAIQAARMKGFADSTDWLRGKRALVAGIGPIGLMAAFALRIKGADVLGMDIVPADSIRPRLLEEIGGKYVDGNSISITDLDEKIGQVDFAFEATGIAKLQIQIIDTLGINGIYVATGIPAGDRPLTINGGLLMQQLVLKNQVVVGSVNAGILHYKQAVDYLEGSQKRWPETIAKVITDRVPYQRFGEVLHHHTADEIKAVVEWAGGQ